MVALNGGLQYSRRASVQLSGRSYIVQPAVVSFGVIGQYWVRVVYASMSVGFAVAVAVEMLNVVVGTNQLVLYVGIEVFGGIVPKIVEGMTKVLDVGEFEGRWSDGMCGMSYTFQFVVMLVGTASQLEEPGGL
jgi:hypothetical protein